MNTVHAATGVACLLGASLVAACGRGAPLPELPEINTIALQRRAVVPADLDRWTPVLEVDASAELTDLRIVSRDGIRWIDPSGRTRRAVVFGADIGQGPVVRTLRDGDAQTWVAFALWRNLSFFDAEGRLIQSQPCRDCWELVAADLEGTGRQHVVARTVGANAGAPRSFSARGVPGPSYPAEGPLGLIAAGRIEDEPADSLLVYTSGDPSQKGAVRVLKGDGSQRARWAVEAGRVLGVATTGGATAAVLAVAGDTLTEQDPLTGAVRWRAAVPASSRFKGGQARRWRDGRRVVLLTQARVGQHMVVVADAAGTLLYRAIVDSDAFDLELPSPTGHGFCVGAVARVDCYEEHGTR